MSREEVIDLEILKYNKKIKFINILSKCISFDNKGAYKKYKEYKEAKYFIIQISKKDKINYITNKYRQYIDESFECIQEKIRFLVTQKDYLEDEIGGIKGKDTNLSITYWLGIIGGLACSIISSIFIERYGSGKAIVLFLLLAIMGFTEIYKSIKNDGFKYYSLIAVESLLQEMCKDNSTNFELKRIENKLDIIEKQIDCFGEKRRSKNSFFDLFANRRIKR